MEKLKRKQYEALLEPLRCELVDMARWIQETRQRVVVLFEGRDTAGKGGAIKAVSEPLNPRHCRTVALGTPGEREAGQWYFQRYVEHLPDRRRNRSVRSQLVQSRGRRTGDGLLHAEHEAKAFLAAAPAFERHARRRRHLPAQILADLRPGEAGGKASPSGSNDPAQALEAVADRPRSARSIRRIHEGARGDAARPPTPNHAPWTLVDFNDQRRGRLTLVRNLLDHLPDTKLPETHVDFPPLPGKPKKERFGVLKPIPPYTHSASERA